MRKTIINIINFYQKFISPQLHQLFGVKNGCRFYPTCSEYAKQKIREKGAIQGSFFAFSRILKCQPFYKGN